MNSLELMTSITNKHARPDQLVSTSIDSLTINQSTKATPLKRGIVKPSLCIIIQGQKEIHIGSEVHHYGPGDFMMSAIDIPVAGRITKASRARPYLGVSIELNAQELSSLMLEADIRFSAGKKTGP